MTPVSTAQPAMDRESATSPQDSRFRRCCTIWPSARDRTSAGMLRIRSFPWSRALTDDGRCLSEQRRKRIVRPDRLCRANCGVSSGAGWLTIDQSDRDLAEPVAARRAVWNVSADAGGSLPRKPRSCCCRRKDPRTRPS